jgi:DNA-directed RNA polymerase specialized sigma24 family protein
MDAELAQQLADGDPTAGPLLVSFVGPKLAGYADRIASDLSPADRDVVVELALAAVIRHIERYDANKGSLATWGRSFLRVALHTWRRAHHGGSAVSLDVISDLPSATAAEPDPVAERRVAAVESLLPNLSLTTQQIIQMHLGEHLTFRQIAELLIEDGASADQVRRFEAACRKRYGRAVAVLRELARDHPDLQDLAQHTGPKEANEY